MLKNSLIFRLPSKIRAYDNAADLPADIPTYAHYAPGVDVISQPAQFGSKFTNGARITHCQNVRVITHKVDKEFLTNLERMVEN